MARSGGFEPPTARFVAGYSIQLSYERVRAATIFSWPKRVKEKRRWAGSNLMLVCCPSGDKCFADLDLNAGSGIGNKNASHRRRVAFNGALGIFFIEKVWQRFKRHPVGGALLVARSGGRVEALLVPETTLAQPAQ